MNKNEDKEGEESQKGALSGGERLLTLKLMGRCMDFSLKATTERVLCGD